MNTNREGIPLDVDTQHEVSRSIVGWVIDGKTKQPVDAVLARILRRLSAIEEALVHADLVRCFRCGRFQKHERVFWHHERRVCAGCCTWLVVDAPEGFKVAQMAAWIVENRLHKSMRSEVEHWAECLTDDRTDLIAAIEDCVRRLGSTEYMFYRKVGR